MKTLFFALLTYSAFSAHAQSLPKSSDKGFADNLLSKKTLPKNRLLTPNFDQITQQPLTSKRVITYTIKNHKMPVLDKKEDNSVIRVYEPDSLFKSNMIVKKYK